MPRVGALGIANGVDDNRIADEKRFFPRIRKLNQLSAPPYLGNEESWNTVSCERFNLGIIFSRLKRIILRVFQIFFNHRYTHKNRRIVWHVEIHCTIER